MNTKVIKVEIERGAAKEDVARQIGDAVAEAIGTAETEDDGIVTETAADNLDRKAIEELKETEDFKAFYDEVTRRVNGLVNLIHANEAKYNCSVVIGVTTAMDKADNLGGMAMAGLHDSLHETFKRILDEAEIRYLAISAALEMATPSCTHQESVQTEYASRGLDGV